MLEHFIIISYIKFIGNRYLPDPDFGLPKMPAKIEYPLIPKQC